MTTYHAADLLRFRSFVLDHPEIKPAEAIRIFNLMKKGADEKLARKILEHANRKRRYFSLDLGEHIRLEMLLYQFSVQAGYSFDDMEAQPHLLWITLGIFSLNISW